VWFDDDDDNDNEGGPPPDPSTREWRHPSEVTAAAVGTPTAAHSMPPRSRPIGFVVAVGLTATALLAIGFGLLALIVTNADKRESASPLADHVGAAAADVGYRSSASTSDESTVTPAPTTTQLALTSTTTPWIQPRSTTIGPEAGSYLWPHEPDRSLAPLDGVFTTTPSAPLRLGGFVVLDDMVYTSASAIFHRDELTLLVGGRWIKVSVLGQDAINDIAVLEVPEDDLQYILEVSASVWTLRADATPPLPGTEVKVHVAGPATPGDDGAATAAMVDMRPDGIITGSKLQTTARAGASIYDSLSTTADLPEGASGSALTDADGAMVGLVIDSTDYLVTAVPVHRVAQVGESLRRWGLPWIAWLGITGESLPDGGVTLSSVQINGPAFAAALETGDVITAINEHEVLGIDHLAYLVRQMGAGTTIVVSYQRDGIAHEAVATVGSLVDLP